MTAVGDLLAGRYRIDAALGTGGTASAWRVRDLRLNRDVAVKVLLPECAADPEMAERFEREARTLATFDDPHLVSVHDVVDGDAPAGTVGEPFLVMELCLEGSLGDRLAGGSALPLGTAAPILAGAAAGLATLHARGVVHGDVTPRNILLAGGSAKLADLGLAGPGPVPVPGADGTAWSGGPVGTLGYMAPERLAGHAATTASDVYGLGAVAYRALCGDLPRPPGSTDEADGEVATAAANPVPPIRARVPHLEIGTADAVDRALDVNPARRPAAAEMAAAFARAAAGEAVTAEAPQGRSILAAATPPGARDAASRLRADSPPGAGGPPPEPTAASRPRKPLPDPGPDYHGPGMWNGELVAVIVVVIVIIGLVILFGGRPG